MRVLPVFWIAERRSGERRPQRCAAQPFRIRWANVDDRVMHKLWTRRPHFRHLHPLSLREVRGHNLVGVFDVAVRGNGHGLGHLQDNIRLWDVPSPRPQPGPWPILRIPGRDIALRPGQDRPNLERSQRGIVGKMPVARIRKPRRHHPRLHRLRNSARPWPSLLVGHQRHRRNFARPMTLLAMLL